MKLSRRNILLATGVGVLAKSGGAIRPARAGVSRRLDQYGEATALWWSEVTENRVGTTTHKAASLGESARQENRSTI